MADKKEKSVFNPTTKQLDVSLQKKIAFSVTSIPFTDGASFIAWIVKPEQANFLRWFFAHLMSTALPVVFRTRNAPASTGFQKSITWQEIVKRTLNNAKGEGKGAKAARLIELQALEVQALRDRKIDLADKYAAEIKTLRKELGLDS